MIEQADTGPRILSAMPLPPACLLLRVSDTSPDESACDDDPDLFTDNFLLVSLVALPGLSTIAAHWGLLRRVRVVGGGKAVAWPTGGEMVQVGVEVLLGVPSAVQVELAELRALTVPVRRKTREQRMVSLH